jgi:hypothetical protein
MAVFWGMNFKILFTIHEKRDQFGGLGVDIVDIDVDLDMYSVSGWNGLN